jgi:hypothetical protein
MGLKRIRRTSWKIVPGSGDDVEWRGRPDGSGGHPVNIRDAFL